MFEGPFAFSILKKAINKNLVKINLINIRDYGIGEHKIVDDTPYGGGIGMVMRVDVIHYALEQIKKNSPPKNTKTILLSAGGTPFNQSIAQKYSKLDHLIIICGHYEGIDARIHSFIDTEISIGDFVTTGGEIPAMLITDSIVRLIPGVLKSGATENESFSIKNEHGDQLLEYPQYTKPQNFKNLTVPDILLSGDHQKINNWRINQAEQRTKLIRPDLKEFKK